MRHRGITLTLTMALASGCYTGLDGISREAGGDDEGAPGQPGGPEGGEEDQDAPEDPTLVAYSGMRRLTTVEYVDTVRDLLGVEATNAQAVLPAPDFIPFDNDYTTQTESAVLIVATESLAYEVAQAVVGNPERLGALLDCPADGPIDAPCFDAFLEAFGRRALRRPLTDAELHAWSGFFLGEAEVAGRFSLAVEVAIQTLLQHPEFVYRIDSGTSVEGMDDVIRLDDWAVASRLSYLLWGTGPDDALLDLAASGGLQTTEDRVATAERMLDDERALARIERFHAMWLGYEFMPIGGEIGEAMRDETGALLKRVILEERGPWRDVLRSTDTYVNEALAEHYGLPAPVDPAGGWVDYGPDGRGGLLSHGTFLSNGFKDGDTSPTLRGKAVRERLLCQTVPPPPPTVNDSVPDAEESPSPCKIDRYAEHDEPGCNACHMLMDGLGFGLENYDQLGQFREHDPGYPECEITGEGDGLGVGPFNGPAELGLILAEDEQVSTCLVTQAYRFAVGRAELDDVDAQLIEHVQQQLGAGEFQFRDLLLEQVASPTFGFARRHHDAPQGDE